MTPVSVTIRYEVEGTTPWRRIEKTVTVMLEAAPLDSAERVLQSWIDEAAIGIDALEAHARAELDKEQARNSSGVVVSDEAQQ